MMANDTDIGARDGRNEKKKARRSRGPGILLSEARCGPPLGSVRFLLEAGARDERLLQVLGIFNDRGDREPLIAVRLVVPVEVLRHDRILAVGDAVFPEIPG